MGRCVDDDILAEIKTRPDIHTERCSNPVAKLSDFGFCSSQW